MFLTAGPFERSTNLTATVTNTSDQPIYQAQLSWYGGTALHGEPDLLGTIVPTEGTDAVHEFPSGTNMDRVGVAVTFYDAAGIRWLKRLDGDLTELSDAP